MELGTVEKIQLCLFVVPGLLDLLDLLRLFILWQRGSFTK